MCPSSTNDPSRFLLTLLQYMLEVIGAGNPDYKGQDWGNVWANSLESKKLTEELENIISSRHNMQEDEKIKDDREYAMPLYTQIVAVTKRAFVAYWRLPDYILVFHFHVTICVAIILLTVSSRAK